MEITTRDGKVIQCQIWREMPDTIFVIRDGEYNDLEPIPRSSIDSIRYGARTSNYGELGVTIGSPAMFNLVVGYMGRLGGVRLSGMFLGGIAGLQLGIPINIARSETISHDISLLLAHTVTNQVGHDFYGIGPAYELNAGGFFFELGYLIGFPAPAIQIGYVHAFR